MHFRTFWEVRPEEISALTDREAVNVVRQILAAEARRQGVPLTYIDLPDEIYVPDQGLDAEVKAGDVQSGIIFPGRTGYQIKTGSFDVDGKGRSEKALLLKPSSLRRRKLSPNDLNPRIRALAEVNGTFVVILFGSGKPGTRDDSIKQRLQDILRGIDPALGFREIHLWRRHHLIEIVNALPALALQIKGHQGTRLLSVSGWSRLGEMSTTFIPGPEQTSFMERLREGLSHDADPTPIRVLGEPGIGKTRLFLEAVRTDPGLSALIVYAPEPEHLFGGPALSQLEMDEQIQAVLVVDECGPTERARLLHCLGPESRKRIRILTIYNQESPTDDDDRRFDVPALGTDQIEQILQEYVRELDVRDWAEWCEGSPRMAHIVGQNLRAHPGQPIRDRDGLLTRFIAGSYSPGSEDFRKRKVVLTSVALFRKFGFEGYVANEATEIYKIVAKRLEPGISESYFRQVINDFRRAKILQGTSTLYITPKLLHVWLWTEWWEVGTAEHYREIWDELPEKLRGWFTDMLAYAQEAPRAVGAIQTLFAPDGPLRSILDGPEDVARLFFHAAMAAADRALNVLEHDLGRRSIEELREFESGRNLVVRALERIAQRLEYFERAATLLLTLAEAENERYSNNATGTFKELFGLGYGPLAPSELPPAERLPFLLGVLRSGRSAQRRIALDAFDDALRTQFVRSGDLDLHGLRRNQALWQPRTYAELFGAHLAYWRALFDAIPLLAAREREVATHIFLRKVRPLCQLPLVAQVVIETLEAALHWEWLSHAELVEKVDEILAYDRQKIDAGVLRRLENLTSRLLGSDFAARLHRYVRLRPIVDEFDKQGQATHGKTTGLQSVVDEVVSDPSLLEAHLHWLITESVKNGYNFGNALAQRDPEATHFWPKIRDALADAGNDAQDFFIGGYLAGVFAQNSERWETLIGELVDCGIEKCLIVHLIWRSGVSARIAELISRWVREHSIGPEELGLLTFGGRVRNFPKAILTEWLELLLAEGTRIAAVTALELASFRCEVGEADLPDELIGRLLLAGSLFGKAGEETDRSSLTPEYHWRLVASRWAGEDPSRLVQLAEALLSAFGDSSGIFYDGDGESRGIIEKAFVADPRGCWQIVSNLISSDGDHRRAWEIEYWLRGSEGVRRKDKNEAPISLMPQEIILAWVNEFPREHAPQAARFVPPVWDADKWEGSLVRKLLVSYGDDENVRAALASNYFTEGWWGPESLHYKGRSEQISTILAAEPDRNARRWLVDLQRALENRIEVATVQEERWF